MFQDSFIHLHILLSIYYTPGPLKTRKFCKLTVSTKFPHKSFSRKRTAAKEESQRCFLHTRSQPTPRGSFSAMNAASASRYLPRASPKNHNSSSKRWVQQPVRVARAPGGGRRVLSRPKEPRRDPRAEHAARLRQESRMRGTGRPALPSPHLEDPGPLRPPPAPPPDFQTCEVGGRGPHFHSPPPAVGFLSRPPAVNFEQSK